MPNAHGKAKILGRTLFVAGVVWLISFFAGDIAPQVIDLVHIPLLCKILATLAVAALAALIVSAAHTKEPTRTVLLYFAISVALALPIGAYVYHRGFDPSRSQFFWLVVNGNGTQKVYPSGDAGGTPETFFKPPIRGGTAHEFTCVQYKAGAGWAFLTMSRKWLPLDELHPPAGKKWPHMPTCP